MEPLHVRLFGTVEAYAGDTRLDRFPTRQASGLFAFLVLNRGRAHTREKLAGTFWATRSEQSARQCLRTAIWRVRTVLEPDGVPPGTYLKAHGSTMEFTGGDAFRLDVAEFEDRLRRAARPDAGDPDIEVCRLLEEAVDIYRGGLLEGSYDDWCLCEQQRLRLLLIGALMNLSEYHARGEAWAEALAWSHRLLDHDPLREHAHRDVMRFQFLTGDRPAALRQFERLAEMLREEFNVAPMPETIALHEAIRAGRLPSSTRATAVCA